MLFNSVIFFIFFPVVTILYFVLPHRFRWALLLAASCFFYMFFKAVYILILFFTIVIDYYAGIWIEESNSHKRRKFFLILSLIANIGVLVVFKYFNFLNDNISGLANLFGFQNNIPYLSILLPIGLSFHTFQAMSYTIEVYRGNQKAERHFGIYSLYVMFYPQLVAGPIERPQNILHQFYQKHSFDYERVTSGLKLMAWGLFKKMVIADRLSVMVDYVYNDPSNHTGLPLVLATLFFSFQIYCDFSGYSDIAIGSAQVMGFRLMDNFNRPYFSKSIGEFWRRWHISLSTWFRDYLYIPLGGSRVAKWKKQRNLFIVFLVSGLWHGASWNFIIWGALHGTFSLIENYTQSFQDKFYSAIGVKNRKVLYDTLRILVVFVLVTFAWIFFRATTLTDAAYIIKHSFLALINPASYKAIFTDAIFLGQDKWYFAITIFAVLFMEFIHMIQRHKSIRHMLASKPLLIRWGVYFSFILSIIFFGKFDSGNFIYFQF